MTCSRIASASSYEDLKALYAAHREHWDDDLTACAARRRMEIAV